MSGTFSLGCLKFCVIMNYSYLRAFENNRKLKFLGPMCRIHVTKTKGVAS